MVSEEEKIPQISAPANLFLQEQLDRAQAAGEGMQEEIREEMQSEERDEEDYGEQVEWCEH